MKSALLALPLLLAAATPAIALAAPAGEEHAAKYSIDTPIETLMADDAARAVVLAELPGLDEHPAYSQFKAMSLKAVQPFSQGMVTDEMLATISTGLAEIH